MSGIVLHLKARDLQSDLKGWHLRLYRIIMALAQVEGIRCTIRQRDADIHVGTRHMPDERFNDGQLHIIDDRSVIARNVLNAGVAYFWEFWHLDRQGVKAFSSASEVAYPAEAAPLSNGVAARLRARYCGQKRSRYDQPALGQHFPKGMIAVFCQGVYPRASGAASLSDLAMLRAVLRGADGRCVVVKPHPLATGRAEWVQMKALELACGPSRLRIVDAHISDMLDAAAVTVSMNSTVALEGMLRNVPAILFGRSDFHHLAGYCAQPEDFAEHLQRELQRNADYDPYLDWYFRNFCLELDRADLAEAIWACFEASGFSRDRLRASRNV